MAHSIDDLRSTLLELATSALRLQSTSAIVNQNSASIPQFTIEVSKIAQRQAILENMIESLRTLKDDFTISTAAIYSRIDDLLAIYTGNYSFIASFIVDEQSQRFPNDFAQISGFTNQIDQLSENVSLKNVSTAPKQISSMVNCALLNDRKCVPFSILK